MGIQVYSKKICWWLYQCIPRDSLEKFSPLPIVRSKDYEIQVDVRSSDNVRGPGEIKRPFIKKDLKRSFIILQGNLIKKRLLTDRILKRKSRIFVSGKIFIFRFIFCKEICCKCLRQVCSRLAFFKRFSKNWMYSSFRILVKRVN